MFFWKPIENRGNLLDIINWHKKNIKLFREKSVKKKWLVFHFIESVVERILDINDSVYTHFVNSKEERDIITRDTIKIIYSGLETLAENTEKILDKYYSFTDKYISSGESSYISSSEMDDFKSEYADMINYLVIYVTTLLTNKIEIKQLSDAINNGITFE